MTITAADLLAKTEKRFKTIELFTGGDAIIQSLDALEMRKFKRALTSKSGEYIRERGERLELLMIAACLVDDNHQPLFTESQVMDGDLDRLDGLLVSQLYKECSEWTGFGTDPDFEAIQDEVKNSRATSDANSS